MDQASEKPVDIDNCLYSRNDKVLEHMSRNIDDYFKKHLGLSPDDAERLHKDYSQQYGQAIEGLVRHHQIDALEYNAKVDDAVPLDDLIKPNAQLRQFLEDIDTSKVPFVCKPHKEMFMKAMREAGVSDVSRCYFIDDSHKNCVGAKDAGWTAIHFVEEGLPVPDTPVSQHQIRHLEELRSLYPDFFRTDDDGFRIEDDDHEPDVEISIVTLFRPNPLPIDLRDLFRLCVSTPIGLDLLLNFGHGYGDVATQDYEGGIEVLVSHFGSADKAVEMLRTNPLQIPALKKAINFAAQILERIVTFLPSPDVHSLRLASRVFATLSLSERFWVSRFTEGHEFDYLPEVFAAPQSHGELSTSPFTSGRLKTGEWETAATWIAFGNLINTTFKPEAPNSGPQRGSLITAERHLFEPGTHFMGGSRVLRARSAEFPQHLKIMLMSVSFVDTPYGPFISGLMFVGADGMFESLGYTHKPQMEHIPLPEDQYVKGFEVALGTCGFRAIAAITEDGTKSSWAGDTADYARRRLTDIEGISLIVAQLLNSIFLWQPEIPSHELFSDGVRPLDEKASSKVPIMTVFFGENDGRYIRQMTSIGTYIHDWCHVDRLNFEFMDDSIERCLGDVEYETEHSGRAPIRFPDHGNSMGHFEIEVEVVKRLRASRFGLTKILFLDPRSDCSYENGESKG
ncbi:pyrimidine 5 -nucleotidase [Fusarium acutatum]|uniref:Pyrimidine 5 -nucleotidase n=1 Tax=Fusarium acutatum TaxID=78861 RepID=A0A8H4JYQ1_9HYPO|nr:pyrimidine 5 -nucleotidase [Fusarium acutatum]